VSGTRTFSSPQAIWRRLSWADGGVVLAIAAVLWVAVKLALRAPAIVHGPDIILAPWALPLYALLSLSRMAAAYALSILFTIAYGYAAARTRAGQILLLPALDVMQSVPILSFLPVVLLSLSAVLPLGLAVELASIVLIFTSQAWNMTFAWYQSLTTIPNELREATSMFQIGGWMRFRNLELPFGTIPLLWNSIMSWAGGWFFLMAAEIFTVGHRDFRLPGLGSYLQAAANKGDLAAIGWGLATLIGLIVVLDQFVWRPLLSWADRFKLEMVESGEPPTSWVHDALRASSLAQWLRASLLRPLLDRVDGLALRHRPVPARRGADRTNTLLLVAAAVAGALVFYLGGRALHLLATLPAFRWGEIALGLGATLLRVAASLVVALAWTIPTGVLIGTNRRLATWLQPLVQIAASVPATALFPVVVLLLVGLPGGFNLAAVLLMLLGSQWYLLFNVIAGASAIPQDLKYTADLLRLPRWQRWRTLILPALYPYLITGSITASGGAWNASIVAEYIQFGGRTLTTRGIGAVIAHATAAGDYPLLVAATLTMVLAVVTVNRALWRRLYRKAEERYRLE
jgi:NitT/TauT family transport system permease protein